VVPVVHFQELQGGMGEVAATAPAYPRVDLQCSLTVALGSLFARASRLGHDAVETGMIRSSFRSWHLEVPGD
jgi:hypothetical protein